MTHRCGGRSSASCRSSCSSSSTASSRSTPSVRGECKPKPVDPNVRILTRDEAGRLVSFPERIGFPPQQRPLVVMTYNIAGHDELYRRRSRREDRRDDQSVQAGHRRPAGSASPHVAGRASAISSTELERLTGMNGYFGRSYRSLGGDFGNAILTRGEIVSAVVHPLPSVGEPRSVLEAVIAHRRRHDQRLRHAPHGVGDASMRRAAESSWSAWRSTSGPAAIRTSCSATSTRRRDAGDRRSSRRKTRRSCAARTSRSRIRCSASASTTSSPTGDGACADARAVATGPSDHYPVIAELFWSRN